uniref:F-box associated domain-containing protein n=1 Tax=Oryza punctata TaxID=4537 RepID=A0A0E0M8X1_ORYPU
MESYHLTNYVLNPYMGYRVTLPNDDAWGYPLLAGCVALGYDAAISRHVVVHFAYKKRNPENRAYELRCHVMLVDDYNEWERARSPPPRPVAEDVSPAYANGKIHWVVDSQLGAPPSYAAAAAACELVALDMEAREPAVPCRHGDGKMTILKLHGALCVACSDKATDAINIWMVKGDGAWSMEYRVELGEFSSETTTPMAVDPMDGRVLLNTGTSLGYYDPKTAALETIYSVSIPDYGDDFPCRDRFYPVICQESPVRVDRGLF